MRFSVAITLSVLFSLLLASTAHARIVMLSSTCDDQDMSQVIDFDAIVAEIERELEVAKRRGMVTKELESDLESAKMPACILEHQTLDRAGSFWSNDNQWPSRELTEVEQPVFDALETFRRALFAFGGMIHQGPRTPGQDPYTYDLDKVEAELANLKNAEAAATEAWDTFQMLERIRAEQATDVFQQDGE